MVGGEHGANRAPVSTPPLDGMHQLAAHTMAPIRLHHTKRVDVQAHKANVAQELACGILGRMLQVGSDIPDHAAVDLGDQPDGIL